MSTQLVFDIRIWEQIRSEVEPKTDSLLNEIRREISGDHSLHDYQGMYPVPWQMEAVMQQRAESWIQRLYELCRDAYKRNGQEVSAEFDRAVWAYWIEPFIMREEQTTANGFRASKLLELLLCAVGSPPENRRMLKVGQRDHCLTVRNEIYFSWHKKLLHLAARLDERTKWVRTGPGQFSTAHAAVQPPAQPSQSPTPVLQMTTPAPSAAPAISQPSAPPPPLGPPTIASQDPQTKVAEPDPSQPAPRFRGATNWQNIEIVFLSDLGVQIRINGKQSEPKTYAELGFDDGRTENPNKAWETLRLLAEHRGVLKDASAAGEPWPKVEKRIQEIRKVLRALFGIAVDPLPFVEGVGYQAVFKIRCGPSFHA